MRRLPDQLLLVGTPARAVLAAILVVALLVGGVTAVRVADVHDPVERESIDTDGDPQAVVTAVNRQLHRVDHRTITRVWEVRADGSRHVRAFYEEARIHSGRTFLANYAGPSPATPGIRSPNPVHHTLLPAAIANPGGRAVFIAADGRYRVATWDAVVQPVPGDYAVPTNATVREGNASAAGLTHYPFFFTRNHSAAWRVVAGNASTVTYGVDDHREYAKTRRLWYATAVHPGSSIRLVVDRETGRPIAVRERRIVSRQVKIEREDGTFADVTRRFEFVLVTRFADVGNLAVSPPPEVAADPPTLRDILWDFLQY